MNGERYKDYVAVPPLMGPAGVRLSNYNPYQYVNQANCYVITKACTDPEAAFRFCDFMYSQDVSMRTRLGEPGTDWIPAPAGRSGVDGEPALYEAILVYRQRADLALAEPQPLLQLFRQQGRPQRQPF